MSLPLIAKHLEDHGRGEDTHLVHMTTGELKALQKMAQEHGGSLTINPSTGLPEAGFLSSILPTVAGIATAAFAPELLPLVAGGVGLADYAMTGSLTQGLMAGLGAWGGGSLAEGFGAAGEQALTQAGGDVGNQAFAQAQAQLADQFPTATADSINQAAAQQAITSENFPNYSTDQLNALKAQATTAADPQQFMQSVGQGNASLGSNVLNPTGTQNLSNMYSGLSNAGSVISAQPGAAMAAAAPILTGALTKQPTIPAATTSTSTNPFGLKTIPRDANGNPIFNATLPTPPSPAYQPTYPNYKLAPYTAASGGLMDVPKFSGTSDYGSYISGINDLESGLATATSPQKLTDAQREMISEGQRGSANGVYQLSDEKYAALNPDKIFKNAHITVAKGLQPVGQLGQFSTDPVVAISQQDIAKDSEKQTSAKEGGLMKHTHRYDGGGEVDLHGTVRPTGGQNSAQGAQGYTPPGGQPYGPAAYSQSSAGNWGNPQQGFIGGLGGQSPMQTGFNPGFGGLPMGQPIGFLQQSCGPVPQPNITLPAPQGNVTCGSSTQPAPLYARGGLLSFASGGSAPAKTSSCSQFGNQSLVNLYQNVLGRAPDQAGYDYWNNAMKNGATINDISKFFVNSPEYQQMGAIQRSPEALQQANAAYTNARYIPQPTRPVPTGSAGYAIDPLKMQGSPAYQQAQAAQAAQQAAQQQQQQCSGGYSYYCGGGGASGGLMPDALRYAIGGNVQDGHLGSYSDGGRLLKGPGDGVSDGIPATIGGKQPARLADGEFVIPARIVSELGNGSTDAGAKRLYAMMDRIKAKRAKAKDIAEDTKAYKYLPA